MADIDLLDNIAENPELNPAGMKKMYLSGPISNVPGYNHDLFNGVATEFRMAGFEVCNPAEFFDGDVTRSRKEYMRESFKYLLEADTVVLLPGWQNSEGAKIEAAMAAQLDLTIVEYVENENSKLSEQQTYLASFTPVDENGEQVVIPGEFTAVDEGEDG